MKKNTFFAIATSGFIGLLCNQSSHAGFVDLSGWSAFDFVPSDPARWTVQPGNSSVLQELNSGPSLFGDPSDRETQGEAWRINARVNPRRTEVFDDDDYFGFILGYGTGQGSYILDWKRGTESLTSGPCFDEGLTDGTEGLALTRYFDGVSGCNFWSHGGGTSPAGLEQRGVSGFGDSGWEFETDYEFTILFTDSLIEVAVNGLLALSATPSDFSIPDSPISSFADGGIGFYNFSQEQVLYSAVQTISCDADSVLACEFPAVPVPAPPTIALLILGGLWLRRGQRMGKAARSLPYR